jgi:hypothetical protein
MAESFVERRAARHRAPGWIEHAAMDDPRVIPRRPESGRAISARTGRAREVIAVFDSPDALQEAVKVLESNGFDRSQIRLLASRDVLEHDLADRFARSGGRADERPFQAPLDRMAVPNVLGMMVTPAALSLRPAHGTLPDGALAGIAVATLATSHEAHLTPGAALGRLLRDDAAVHLEEQIGRRRVLLWVSLPRPEREATAREILARHAEDVRAYMS